MRLILLISALFITFEANAQQFGNDVKQNLSTTEDLKAYRASVNQRNLKKESKDTQDNSMVAKKNGDFLTMPMPAEKAKFDGVKRGNAPIERVYRKGEKMNPRDSEFIFMYYNDFSIYRSIDGAVSCNVSFYVFSNLNKDINNLSAKLVWPEISTSVVFENIMPNRPTYVEYALMGKGCYSMDKSPNIVVNRCRVKGMSASECASKIKWVKLVK